MAARVLLLSLLFARGFALDWPLAAPHLQSVIANKMTHWRQSSVPTQLWQTDLTSDGTPEAASQTWQQKNPTLTRKHMNVTEAENFMQTWFSSQVLAVYRSLPQPMQADFWRYAALFIHGGFYADMNQMCNRPIHTWMELHGENRRASALYSWSTCSIIIGMENDVHFCQWAFASVRGHPVLAWILQLVAERSSAYDASRLHARHYYTGPGVFTDAILSILQLKDVRVPDAVNMVFNDKKVMQRALELGICFVDVPFFGGHNVAKFVATATPAPSQESAPTPANEVKPKQDKPATENVTPTKEPAKPSVTEDKSKDNNVMAKYLLDSMADTTTDAGLGTAEQEAREAWFGL